MCADIAYVLVDDSSNDNNNNVYIVPVYYNVYTCVFTLIGIEHSAAVCLHKMVMNIKCGIMDGSYYYLFSRPCVQIPL